MQTQFILRMVLAVLALKYADVFANTKRGHFQIDIPNLNQEELTVSGHDISFILEQMGITTDLESEVQIHHEKNHINLSCFNCIINITNKREVGPINDFIIR